MFCKVTKQNVAQKTHLYRLLFTCASAAIFTFLSRQFTRFFGLPNLVTTDPVIECDYRPIPICG